LADEALATLLIDAQTERAVRLFIDRIAQQNDLVGAILFGSRALGTHQPDSDADVAVLLSGEHGRFLPTKLAMADIAFDVLLDTGINISPLPVWLDEWEHPETYSNPGLLANIAKDGIRL
jgi:predicted nucleotidyltransferase